MHENINKVQYIAMNSIEVPRDVLEELQLYEDYPMILELKSGIIENDR